MFSPGGRDLGSPSNVVEETLFVHDHMIQKGNMPMTALGSLFSNRNAANPIAGAVVRPAGSGNNLLFWKGP